MSDNQGFEEFISDGDGSANPSDEVDFRAGTEVAVPDPSTVITLRTSGGDTRYVETDAPMSIGQAILQSGLPVAGSVQYWLNGVQGNLETIVPVGQTVTIIGNVKGGLL
jgi:hypothetical protein